MDIRTYRTILLTTIYLFIVSQCSAQADRSNRVLSTKVDEYMNALVKLDRFSGAIMIAQGGRVLVSKGYGMANLEEDVPCTPQTKFLIGSMTKQFTAMAVMILQERGKLSVQDPICKYLTDCPAAWQQVTIHHLLTHTSGIPDFFRFDYKKTMASPRTLNQFVEMFKDKPLDFTPGSKLGYSGSGYILLGVIVGKASGQTYESFVKENIFTPLQMTNSGFADNLSVIKHFAIGYARRNNAYLHADYEDRSTVTADGNNLYSTVGDLLLWDQALYTEKLVSKKSLEAIFTPYTPEQFYWHGYIRFGYGWRTARLFNRRLVFHTGHSFGFITYIGRYPDDNGSVIILSNVENASLRRASRDLAAIVFGERYNLPRAPVKVNPQLYAAYVGQYQAPDGYRFNIERENDKLIIVPAPGIKIDLIPQSDTEFEIFTGTLDDQLVFVKDEKGQVTHLLIDWDTQVKKIK
jgi:CubicO group peptidase (beta-lactamase class C family)